MKSCQVEQTGPKKGGSPADKEMPKTGKKASDVLSLLLVLAALVPLVYGIQEESHWAALIGLAGMLLGLTVMLVPEWHNRQQRGPQPAAENRAVSTSRQQAPSVETPEQPKRTETGAAAGFTELVETVTEILPRLRKLREIEDQLHAAREEAKDCRYKVAEWHKAAVEFIDFLDDTLSLEGLNAVYRSAFQKARAEFVRKAWALGLEEICPSPGEPFDERLHIAEGDKPADGLPAGTVAEVKKSGFRHGSQVYRKARVWVVSE